MRSPVPGVLLFFVALIGAAPPAGGHQPIPVAEGYIPVLSPAAFPELPPETREELERRNCVVPQIPLPGPRHNVAIGEFAASGQRDIAVLCSIDGQSRILVLWGGPARCPSELATSSDRKYLQNLGRPFPNGARFGYSREIRVAHREFFVGHELHEPPPGPKSEWHEGIEDAFIEKSSGVHYCQDGRWLALRGGD